MLTTPFDPRLLRRSAAGVSLAALACALPAPAGATVTVRSTSELHAAVERLRASGGTIVLAGGRYEQIVVGPRGPRRLVITATRGASAGRVVLVRTRAVTIRGLRVTPRSGDASLAVEASRGIRLERLVVAGRGRLGSQVSVERSAGVVVVASSFSRCGEGSSSRARMCLRLSRAAGVVVRSARFRDCFGCDFVHGSLNRRVRIEDSTFDRAVPGVCRDRPECHHQDLIHLIGGGSLLIHRNRFGVFQHGAAQIFLTRRIEGVRIENNLFLRTDPRVPGYVTTTAIWIGGRRCCVERLARDVTVVNNTILSGALRPSGERVSLLLSPLYTQIPAGRRPLVANNVLGIARAPGRHCAYARASVRNVIVRGEPCTETDLAGNPGLDAAGRPTVGSLVVDRADARFAPRFDALRVRRDANPDIGAYELRRSG